jgi:membrane-associated phospholipid phosphatase
MKNILKKHRIYFTVYALFLVISAIVLSLFSKIEIHLFINKFYSPFTDFIFKYLTDLGDGLAIAVVAVILLFINIKMALQVIISGIFSGFIAQFLKKVVFGSSPRPSAFFNDLNIPLHYVDGVELHSAFSFPSGHSTAIFALITSLLLILNNKKWGLPLIITAILVAFSRIYLSQHFLGDIFVGSTIGVSVSLLTYWIIFIKDSNRFNKLDKPLINSSIKS